jgi:hypothetical protein
MSSKDNSGDDFTFFGGMNITALSDHKRDKKTLRGPFHRIRDLASFSFSSWRDGFLPLYSWCALLVGALKRDEYLEKFRSTIMRVKHRHDNFDEDTYLDHIALEQLSNHQFDFIFEPLLKNAELRKMLSILGGIESLPDANHWKICLNSLHRFHRIPDVPRLFQQSLLPDMCAIINKMLDDLAMLYPPFKSRIRSQRKSGDRKTRRRKEG